MNNNFLDMSEITPAVVADAKPKIALPRRTIALPDDTYTKLSALADSHGVHRTTMVKILLLSAEQNLKNKL